MEIGRIEWNIKCPKCGQPYSTLDPAKIVPEHKAQGVVCPGSGMTGIQIGKKINPKII